MTDAQQIIILIIWILITIIIGVVRAWYKRLADCHDYDSPNYFPELHDRGVSESCNEGFTLFLILLLFPIGIPYVILRTIFLNIIKSNKRTIDKETDNLKHLIDK